MKQFLVDRLEAWFKSPHISASAFISAGIGVAIIWKPQYSQQLAGTLVVLQAYGLAMPAKTQPTNPHE